MCGVNASWHNNTHFWRQLCGLTGKLNGTWYSTRKPGQCPPGVRPGLYTAADGTTRRCFWREATVLRNVNATCVQVGLQANATCVRRTRTKKTLLSHSISISYLIQNAVNMNDMHHPEICAPMHSHNRTITQSHCRARVQNALVTAVVSHNADCFNACPQPGNRSTLCWYE